MKQELVPEMAGLEEKGDSQSICPEADPAQKLN
jgi:hypothetical protein